MECTVKTLKGLRCKNSAIKGTDKCKIHSKSKSLPKKLKTLVKKGVSLPSKTKMSTLKKDLLVFVNKNIINQIISDDDNIQNEMASLLNLLKYNEQWKDLDAVKDTVFRISSFPPWMLEGLTPSNKLISKHLEKASLEIQAIIKAHVNDPVAKPKKSKL